jgi:adenylate cyclase class 2
MEAIFNRLGYRPVFTYEKFRTEYRQPGRSGVATVDQTPIGTYIELEGPAIWIDRTARKLGFSADDYILDSYGRLYLRWADRQGIAPSNMVFSRKRSRH